MNKIIIIGGGSIGLRHARNLIALGEKDLAIVEINADRAIAIQKELGVTVYPSLEEAWKENGCQVAFICSPSVFHTQQALYCAERGAHLFIEKPISHNEKDLDQLAALVDQKHLITMIGSNWKFYPLFLKMKELLDSGAIGKVLSARCQFGQYLPDWHPWEDYRKGYSANKKLGGGILLDSHEFDYLSWFLGAASRVTCFAKKVSDLEIDVEDVAAAIIEFKSGVIGEIHLDYLQRFYQRNFEFFGDKGTLIWDNSAKQVIVQNVESGKEVFPLEATYEINTMYSEEIKHFLECVKNKKETITPVSYGISIVRLIMAAKRSAEAGQAITL